MSEIGTCWGKQDYPKNVNATKMKHPWKDFAGFQYGRIVVGVKQKNYIRWKPRNKLTLREINTLRYNHNYLKNNPQYAKYFEEYKVHCWVPPLNILFPKDNSIQEYGRF